MNLAATNNARILASMADGLPMTAHDIAEASGVSMVIVANYLPRLCMAGKAKCVVRKRPKQYQVADAPAEPIAVQARRNSPNSVFALGSMS